MQASFRPHCKPDAQGHIYINKIGACTIQLIGASSMSQRELNFYGAIMAKAIENMSEKELKKAAKFASVRREQS